MSLVDRIGELVAPTVEALGFEVVRVMLMGTQKPCLQVMLDRADETAITVDDCARASRAISAVLDVEDPVPGGYTLEVSSPGIDRPLVRRRDFDRFAGFEARVEMAVPVAGQKRFRGRLVGCADDDVRMIVDGNEVTLPFADIARAKLVLTDDLIAASEGQKRP